MTLRRSACAGRWAGVRGMRAMRNHCQAAGPATGPLLPSPPPLAGSRRRRVTPAPRPCQPLSTTWIRPSLNWARRIRRGSRAQAQAWPCPRQRRCKGARPRPGGTRRSPLRAGGQRGPRATGARLGPFQRALGCGCCPRWGRAPWWPPLAMLRWTCCSRSRGSLGHVPAPPPLLFYAVWTRFGKNFTRFGGFYAGLASPRLKFHVIIYMCYYFYYWR